MKIMNKIYGSVTVIVPAYNCEKTIVRCIKSLLKQSYSNYEILVINDGSRDNTLEKLRQFKNRIRVISYSDNRGVSVARNLGIKYSKSKYLAFVDSDDYVNTDFLKHLVEKIIISNVDLSISGMNYVFENGKNQLLKFENKIIDSSYILKHIIDNNGVKGYLCNKLWKRQIIQKFNLKLNEKIGMSEDLLFTVEYLQHCAKVCTIDSIDYFYVQSKRSLSDRLPIKKRNPKIIKSCKDNIYVLNTILDIFINKNYKNKLNEIYALIGIDYMFIIQNSKNIENSLNFNQFSKLKQYKKYVLNSKNIGLKTKINYCLTFLLIEFKKGRD